MAIFSPRPHKARVSGPITAHCCFQAFILPSLPTLLGYMLLGNTPTAAFLQLTHQLVASFNHWLTTPPSTPTLPTFSGTSTSLIQCTQHAGSALPDQLVSVLRSSHPPTTRARAWSTMTTAVPPPKAVSTLSINPQRHLLFISSSQYFNSTNSLTSPGLPIH